MPSNIDLNLVVRFIDRSSRGRKTALTGLARITKEARRASRAGFRLAANMNQAGEAVSRFGRLGRRALGAPVKAASEFGEAMAEVSTLVDTSEVSVKELADTTLALTTQFGGDAVGQAKALYQGISAGAKAGAEATALLTAANEFALGGVTDVETGVDALTSVVNAYGLSMTEAKTVSDSFFVAIREGKTTAEELASAVGFVAPIASKAGVSMDEMNAAIAAITKTGLKTDNAVTGLKAAFTSILKPSSDAKRAAKAMGIEFGVAGLKSKGFSKFLNEVLEKSGATPKQLRKLAAEAKRTGKPVEELAEKYGAQTQNLVRLFPNVRALNAVLALSAEGGKNFNDVMEAMASKTGETDKAANKMKKTFAFQAREMKALGQVALIELGQTFIPIIKEMLPEIRELLKTIRQWVKENPDLARTLGKAAVAVTALATVFGPLLFAAASFVSLLSGGAGMIAMLGKLHKASTLATLGIGKGFGPAIAKAGAAVGARGGVFGKGLGFLITKMGPLGMVAAAGAAGFAIGTLADKLTGGRISGAVDQLFGKITGLNAELAALDRAAGGRTDVRGAGFLSEEQGAAKAGLSIEEFRQFKSFGQAATEENLSKFMAGKLDASIRITVDSEGRATARVDSASSNVGDVNVDGGVAMAGA